MLRASVSQPVGRLLAGPRSAAQRPAREGRCRRL